MSGPRQTRKKGDESPIRVGKGLDDSRPEECSRLLDHLRFGRYDEVLSESEALLADLGVTAETTLVPDIRAAARASFYRYEVFVKRGQGMLPSSIDAYTHAKELIGPAGLTANFSRIERVLAYSHLMEYVIDGDRSHLDRALEAVGNAEARALELRNEPDMDENLVIRQLLECGTVRAEVALALGDPMTADRYILENMPAISIWEIDSWNKQAHRCVEALQYAYLHFDDADEIEARFRVGFDRLEELNIAFDCAWYALHMGIRTGERKWYERARSGFFRLGNTRLESLAAEALRPRTVAIGLSLGERRKRLLEKIGLASAQDPKADLLLVGESLEAAVEQVCDLVEASKEPVLIEGESGTGKTKVSRLAHYVSGQYRTGKFLRVQLNLGTELVGKAFFGQSKGAFTGANQAETGIFGQAAGGTLLVDEIDKVSIEIHDQFLMPFDDGKFRRVGDGKEFEITNTLLLFGSSTSIQRLVDEGKMRPDLQYRIAQGGRVVMPPLRENGQLLAALARRFAATISEKRGMRLEVMPAALRVLGYRQWPGNIREFRAYMVLAVSVASQRGENAITRDVAVQALEIHDQQMLEQSAVAVALGSDMSQLAAAMTRNPAFREWAKFLSGKSALTVKFDDLRAELAREAIRHAESVVGTRRIAVAEFLGISESAIQQRRDKEKKRRGLGEAENVESID